MHIEWFEFTRALMDYGASKSDKSIQPQGVISKIIMPKVCSPRDIETWNDSLLASSSDAI